MAYMKPLQAALRSIAGQSSPSSLATMVRWRERCGRASSSRVPGSRCRRWLDAGVVDAPLRRRGRPGFAAVPPMRRSRMPVRSAIHSSEVSRVWRARRW